MLILFCDKCGVRVAEADLVTGIAKRTSENAALCAKCTAPICSSATVQRMLPARPTAVSDRRETAALPERMLHRQSATTPKAGLLAFGISIVVVMGGILVFLLTRPEKPHESMNKPPNQTAVAKVPPKPAMQKPPPKEPPHPVREPSPQPAPSPQPRDNAGAVATKGNALGDMSSFRDKLAADLLQGAKALVKGSPEEIDACVEKLELLTTTYRSTPAGSEAATLLVELNRTRPERKPDIVLQDFEGADYGDWKVRGTAFGMRPANGKLPGQMHVTGYLGNGLANSFHGGDGTTGTLTSPPFKIERRYLVFMIGGGGFAGETCMNLLVEGAVVRTATGPNTVPGGSEQLSCQSWNVVELAGKEAVIQIVDKRSGGWGHINVDQIVYSDQKR